ncbi:hypothetical protein RhiirA4_431357 [Rhizophagus irregularis]|uniref:Uncharacterized protein n=1 Tax=Rhizophagus irregularis TaxID=588596 RepID=A0A2I1HPF2_9GLOM|nr:hypothetical protein RhiirA4_431357 [Rhizophagus irregularis]
MEISHKFSSEKKILRYSFFWKRRMERTYGWHEALESYYFLGEELEKRFYHYKKFLNELNAQLKVSKEMQNEKPHEVLESYYFLGEELEKRLYHYKKFLNELNAKLKVSKEINVIKINFRMFITADASFENFQVYPIG